MSNIKGKSIIQKLFNWLCIAMMTILAGQLYAAESYGKAEDTVVAEVLGMQIRTKNPEEMQSVITQKLFQDYAKQNRIEASQKDIDLYIANMDHFLRDDRKKKDARRVEIQQQLKAESLPAQQTKQLRSELDVLENLHKYDLQEDSERERDPEAIHKALQTVAKAIIEHWMINKALYQQYGGRIIGQQMGPEPLDAIHDYLKEQQKKGAFKILKKSFEAPFWEYFVTDSKHSFYKQGSEEERQAFDKPLWLQK